MTTQSGPSAVPTAAVTRADAMPAVREARAGVLQATAPPARRVAILGSDAALETLLRDSTVGVNFVGARTLTALADLIVLRPCDALVVDMTALGAASSRVCALLAAQFPDLPIVAVGNRTDEAAVAGLISGGQVYRFLHRPLSPERARTLLGAALRRHAASSARELPAPRSSASTRAAPVIAAARSAAAAVPAAPPHTLTPATARPAVPPPTPGTAVARPAVPPPTPRTAVARPAAPPPTPRPAAARPTAPPAPALPEARGAEDLMSPATILACGIGLALLALVAWWMLGAAPR